MHMMRTAVLFLAVFSLLGCDKDEGIAIYTAPKDPAPATAPVMNIADAINAPQADPHGNAHGAAATSLTWSVPEGWKQEAGSEMRFATLVVNDNPRVELTVIPLGGSAGDVQANVNRWEGQLGLPATPAEKLDAIVKKTSPNGLDVKAVDLAGKDNRMLAAIVPHGGRVWFFKVVGPPDIVGKQKEKFDTFLASLKPDAAAAPNAAAAPAAPNASAAPAAQAAATMKLKSFKTPDGWKEIPNSTGPRMIAFNIGPEDQKADLIVTRFGANNAGNFLDNINRWRNQLGLPPVADTREVAMTDATAGNEPAVAVEIDNPGGADKPARRMRVAMAAVGPDLWFFKMTGPPQVIEQQKPAFDDFLKSIQFAPEGAAP
jgi:hypothetical protein